MNITKSLHEIRDPIHVFIYLNSDERKVLDSIAFQRLRHIRQLAFSFFIYPGATHTRFEHSLGVMELATRIFDRVTDSKNLHDKVKHIVPQEPIKITYWRQALRMAALCHDLGHLPFSHAAEKELLAGKTHEDITIKIIESDLMREIWRSMTPPLREEDIVKLAVGQKQLPKVKFSDWEAILSEIVVSDIFGADRMDYLLRDAYHAGVVYGSFDHNHLIDNIRILPKAKEPDSIEPELGIERGGIHSAEALLLARYFMYSQVYFHPVRKIYDIHLKDFMNLLYPNGSFPTDVLEFLKITDNEIFTEIYRYARNSGDNKHIAAKLLAAREHFKVVYDSNPVDDKSPTENSPQKIFEALVVKYGSEKIRIFPYDKKVGSHNFPVRGKDGRIFSSLEISDVLKNIPNIKKSFVYCSRDVYENAKTFIETERDNILRREDNNG